MTLPYSMPPSEQPHPLSGDIISPAYIHTVQHLIEKCLLFDLDREECVASLDKHAKVKPAITRTVWDELVKANKEFFTAYFQRLSRSSSHNNSTNAESLNKALLEATNAMCQQSLDD